MNIFTRPETLTLPADHYDEITETQYRERLAVLKETR